MFCEKGVLRNLAKFTGKTPVSESLFNKVAGKETLALSCEFCEISKNIFSYRIPPVAPSVLLVNRDIFTVNSMYHTTTIK